MLRNIWVERLFLNKWSAAFVLVHGIVVISLALFSILYSGYGNGNSSVFEAGISIIDYIPKSIATFFSNYAIQQSPVSRPFSKDVVEVYSYLELVVFFLLGSAQWSILGGAAKLWLGIIKGIPSKPSKKASLNPDPQS